MHQLHSVYACMHKHKYADVGEMVQWLEEQIQEQEVDEALKRKAQKSLNPDAEEFFPIHAILYSI